MLTKAMLSKFKKLKPQICCVCGKDLKAEDAEYVKTKRGYEHWLHGRCLKNDDWRI